MKKIFLLLFLFVAITFSQSIEIKSTLSYTNTVSYEFYIVNTGSSEYDISNHTVDFYTNEIEGDIDLTQPNVFTFSYFSCEVNNNVTMPYPTGSYTTITPVTQNGKSANVKFAFVLPSNITPIEPGRHLRFSGNIYENDYSHQFVSSDDWSYLSASQSVNTNVVLRNSGGIVYGNAPRGNTAPTIVFPVTEVVSENSASGTLVATLNATDAEGDTYTFALGIIGANNALFEIQNGNKLIAKQPLDYENGNNGLYTYSIIVTDQFGASSEDTEFTFGVTDVDPEYEYPEVTGANEDMKVEGISQFSNPKAPENNVTIINGGEITAKSIKAKLIGFESPSRASEGGSSDNSKDIILTQDEAQYNNHVNDYEKYFNNPTTEISNGELRFLEYKTVPGKGRVPFNSGFTPTKVYTDSAQVNLVISKAMQSDNFELKKTLNGDEHYLVRGVGDSLKLEYNKGGGLASELSYYTPGYAEISKKIDGILSRTTINGGTITAKTINAENIAGTVKLDKIAIATGAEEPTSQIQIGENNGDHLGINAGDIKLYNHYSYTGGSVDFYIDILNNKQFHGNGSSGDIGISVKSISNLGTTNESKITPNNISTPELNTTNINTSNISTGSINSELNITVGHGNWLNLNNMSDNKKWMIHNPSGQDKLEIGRYDGTSNQFGYLAILENGNVGIGTTTPESKLHVNGAIQATSVKIGEWTIETPDYVFQPDYKLRSLDEVEAHIKEKSHLPEVPSAADMKRDGVDLAEMNMILLKKVEELTLYMIEQDKKIDMQGKMICDLVNKNKKTLK